jgi:outer membrane lipoprotein SlyB
MQKQAAMIATSDRARRVQPIALAVFVIALSACATHTEVRQTPSNSAPNPNASPAASSTANPTPTAKTCPSGNGVVMRVVPINAAGHNANVDLMSGGVVGGVLGNQGGSGNAQGGASGGGPNGDVVRYDLYVKLDNGGRFIVNQRDATGIVTGSRVTVESCRARLVR